MADSDTVINKTFDEDEFVVAFSEAQCDCGTTESYLMTERKPPEVGNEYLMYHTDTDKDKNFSHDFGKCKSKYNPNEDKKCFKSFIKTWFGANSNIVYTEQPMQEYYCLMFSIDKSLKEGFLEAERIHHESNSSNFMALDGLFINNYATNPGMDSVWDTKGDINTFRAQRTAILNGAEVLEGPPQLQIMRPNDPIVLAKNNLYGKMSLVENQIAEAEKLREQLTGDTAKKKNPLIFSSKLVCKLGGVISVTFIGQRFENNFIYSAQFRRLIEAISHSKLDRNNKNNLVIGVYEKYLYQKHNAELDAYNITRMKYDKERSPHGVDGEWGDASSGTKAKLVAAEKELAKILQNSDTDIMKIVNMMGQDIIKTSPRPENNFGEDLWDFLKLVETDSPPDVKNRSLKKALGLSDEYAHLYSIWSRGWFPQYNYEAEKYQNMSAEEIDEHKTPIAYAEADRNDYLGNYLFGYIGMGYWEGFTFQYAEESSDNRGWFETNFRPFKTFKQGAVRNYYLLTGYPANYHSDDPVRKSQAESQMLLLWGAGLAQVKLDSKDDFWGAVGGYIDDIEEGKIDAGENEGDSRKTMEGVSAWGTDSSNIVKCSLCGQTHGHK